MTAEGFSSREAIVEGQLAALRRLLSAVAKTTPFYGPVVREAGLADGASSLDDFFVRMPLTTKAQLIDDQRRNPPYGTNLTFPLSDYSRYNQTSATSGPPLRWLDTRESWQWMLDNWKQVYRAAGVTAEDCLYFAFSFGPYLGFWTAFDAAAQLGCLCLPGGGLSSAARLEAIRDNGATVLLSTPCGWPRWPRRRRSSWQACRFARSSWRASRAGACPASAERSKTVGRGPPCSTTTA